MRNRECDADGNRIGKEKEKNTEKESNTQKTHTEKRSHYVQGLAYYAVPFCCVARDWFHDIATNRNIFFKKLKQRVIQPPPPQFFCSTD